VAAQPRTHPHREDALPYLEGVETCIYALHVDGRSQRRGRQHRDVQEIIIIVFIIVIVIFVIVFIVFVSGHV
jgi:t-SNARE complex subunit (syntaxin)